MIWLYAGAPGRLLYEIRRELIGEGYEIVVTYPDGRVRIERAGDSSELIRRSEQIRRELEAEGWTAIAEA